MLLEGWYVHQAVLDKGKKAAAHRLWLVEGIETHLRTLCGQVWLAEQKQQVALRSHEKSGLSWIIDPCGRCQRIENRYTAHDEAK